MVGFVVMVVPCHAGLIVVFLLDFTSNYQLSGQDLQKIITLCHAFALQMQSMW